MRTNFIAAVFGLTLAGMTSALPTEDSSLYSFLSRRATSPDNSCGIQLDGTNSGYVCDAAVSEGGCCSQYGFCGSSDDYCNAIGCQTAYGTCNAPSTTIPPAEDDFTCGPNNGGKTCSGTLCCSQNGFCGNTTDYCGAGCNSAYGKCSGNSNEAPGGTCGPNFGNTKCSDNQCCSQIGYCGITSDFCADPGSCLPGFGRCDSDTTPAGQSTANVARPKKGPVPYTEDIYDCVQNNVVALTYDDGPSAYTSQLLDLLKKYSFTATFFITGNNNGKGPIDTTSPYPDLIKRMVAEGHQVASHTWSHYSLTDSTSDVRKSQMVKNEMALNNIIGKWPTYMRPPYSQCSKESGCWADMEALGYHRVYFDLDTQDYLNPLPSQIQNSKLIVQTELADLTATDYLSIQHDIVQQSVTNLTSFYFDQIVKRGWKGVTAAECLGDTNKDNWYRSLSSSSSSTSAASSSTSRTSTTTATTTRASTTTATTTTRASTTTTSAATTSPTPSPPTCILKNGNWCGQIDPFTDAQSCRKAAADCGVETVKCYAANWFGFTTCIKWSPICAKLNTFCWTCSAKGNCNNKAFGY